MQSTLPQYLSILHLPLCSPKQLNDNGGFVLSWTDVKPPKPEAIKICLKQSYSPTEMLEMLRKFSGRRIFLYRAGYWHGLCREKHKASPLLNSGQVLSHCPFFVALSLPSLCPLPPISVASCFPNDGTNLCSAPSIFYCCLCHHTPFQRIPRHRNSKALY